MQRIDQPDELKDLAKTWLQQELSIGLVMTMGHLHAGHSSLIQRAQQENDITLVSIFVNSTQFNQASDFEQYPRTLQQDLEQLQQLGVSAVFTPDTESIYADQYRYRVQETEMSQLMEGQFRPGHFDGVLTVVLKVLLLSQATRAYFSEKDYQQLKLIEGMAAAFFLDTKIVACPFVRDEHGLALSSRNSRLNTEQLDLARQFARCLQQSVSKEDLSIALSSLGLKVDYVQDWQQRRLAAVYIDAVRLIDNRRIDDCNNKE